MGRNKDVTSKLKKNCTQLLSDVNTHFEIAKNLKIDCKTMKKRNGKHWQDKNRKNN